MIFVGIVAIAAATTSAAALAGESSPGAKRLAEQSGAMCGGLEPSIVASDGDDHGATRIDGTDGDDVIIARQGNDIVYGGAGDDLICARGGDDRVHGGTGNDIMRASGGTDIASGGPGADRIRGGAGDDDLFGDEDRDNLDGGSGQDECSGGPGRNEMRHCESPNPPAAGNLAPDAVDDTASTDKDSPIAVDVLANDRDDDLDPLSVSAIDDAGTRGRVTLSDGGVTYSPDGAFDSLGGDRTDTDTFSYTASDGRGGSDTARVTVTIGGVDHPPAAVNDSATVTEDSGATAIDVLANDTDVDGGSKSIQSASDPAHGTTAITGGGTGLTYRPDADYCNAPGSAPDDTFTYDLNGGSTATVSVAVNCVNDAPTVSTTNSVLAYTENDPATPVDSGVNVADVDSQIAGATVEISSNHAAPEDVLALPVQPGITGSYNSGTGVLTLNGTASPAAYQSALRAVTYRNTSNNPSTAQRTVRFRVTDADGAPSAFATRGIDVTATNNGPDVDNSAGALAYTENDPATAIDTTITITDVDSTNLTGAQAQITGNHASGQDVLALPAQPTITGSFNSGSGTLTLSGTATIAEYETALEAVTYLNTSDNPSTATRTVTYQARDAGGFGAPDTHAVTIAAVDDPPVAVNDSATVAEDSGANAINVLGNDTDIDAGPKSIASVTQPANGTVVITGGGTGLTYAPNANYCNLPPGTTPDTFTYTLTPGGSSATVSMNVTCVDDPPVAVNDNATVGEDSGANTINVLANDTDIDGGPISVSSVTQPANGVAVNNGTDVTYVPNANYCNSPPGTTPDTFTYTLSPGGSTATVSVIVTCSDDPPVAVNDAPIVAEDSVGNPVDVLANDTDVDGGPKSVQSVTQPADGAAVVTGGGTGVAYTPNANYCNSPPGTSPDTFTYSLNGGSTATVSVTVTCSADSPHVNTSPGTTPYTENAAPTPIDSAVTVADPDGSSITGATVQISANFAGAQDNLALAGVHPGITALQIGDTLTLSGTASPAAYQSALRDVTYRNTSDSPSTLLRTVTFTVTDDTALSGSDTKNLQVTAVDDNPVAVNDSTTVGEDSGATLIFVLTNDTDVDGGPIAVSSVTQPANGTVSNNGTDVTYTPNANYCNSPPGTDPDTFTYTLTPGGSTATVSVLVTCSDDDPPDVAISGDFEVLFTWDEPARPIDPGITVTDPDPGAEITGATVAITDNFHEGEDVLALAGVHPGISAGPQVGNTLTLTGTASPAAYQAALRDVTYENVSGTPSGDVRPVHFTVTDDTALSDSDDLQIYF